MKLTESERGEAFEAMCRRQAEAKNDEMLRLGFPSLGFLMFAVYLLAFALSWYLAAATRREGCPTAPWDGSIAALLTYWCK